MIRVEWGVHLPRAALDLVAARSQRHATKDQGPIEINIGLDGGHSGALLLFTFSPLKGFPFGDSLHNENIKILLPYTCMRYMYVLWRATEINFHFVHLMEFTCCVSAQKDSCILWLICPLPSTISICCPEGLHQLHSLTAWLFRFQAICYLLFDGCLSDFA